MKKLTEPNERDHHFKKQHGCSIPVLAVISSGMPMIRKQNTNDLKMLSNCLAVLVNNSFPCLIGSLLVDITGCVTGLDAISVKTAGPTKLRFRMNVYIYIYSIYL